MKYPEIANFLEFSVCQGILDEKNIDNWLENIINNNSIWPEWVDEIYLISDKKHKLLSLYSLGSYCNQETAANLILELIYKKWKDNNISLPQLERALLSLSAYDYFFEEYEPGYADWIKCLHSYLDDYSNPLVGGEEVEKECKEFVDQTFSKFYTEKNLLQQMSWLVLY
jgi:hypothetical protein